MGHGSLPRTIIKSDKQIAVWLIEMTGNQAMKLGST